MKKNKPVYNFIGWSNSDNDASPDSGGAVEVSREMYTDKNTYGVTSTLCYGVQWDTALRFIDPSYMGYAKDSTGKGNYSGNLINTGTEESYSLKNIYDMAGNVYELTMETYYNYSRVARGGSYNSDGFNVPSSLRYRTYYNDTSKYYGFRVALYV